MPDQTERPEPHEAPDGFVYVAVPAGPEWRVQTGKRCRAAGQRGRDRCPNEPVAELNRSWWRGGATPRWWAYCPEHMYGRWCEDGQVMQYVLRPVEESGITYTGGLRRAAKLIDSQLGEVSE